MRDALALKPPVTEVASPARRTVRHVVRRSRPGRVWLRGLVLPALIFGFMELAAQQQWVQARLLPPPSEIARTLWLLTGDGLWTHVGTSLVRVASGFAIGAVLGLFAAVLVSLNRCVAEFVDPSFQALRNVPSLAWVPLLLLWFGIDETPKITMIALGAFFPVYLNVVSGLRHVDRKLIEVGEIHGLGAGALARRILLPASLPSVFTGLRTALGLAWMFLVAAELIAATRGLGYLLSDGRETGRPDVVIAAIFLIALLGKLSDSLLQAIEARSLRWRDTLDNRTSQGSA